MIHSFIALLLIPEPLAAEAAAAKKHDYCVVRPGQTPHCQDCAVRLGGEGGKLLCAYKFRARSVRYGRCDEARNRPPC